MKNNLFYKVLRLLVVVLLFSCTPQEEQARLMSPDGRICVEVHNRDAMLRYNVSYHGDTIIKSSALGFQFQRMPDIGKDIAIQGISHASYDTIWERLWGEERLIRNYYNEMDVVLKEKSFPERSFKLVFRVYNDGLAFRYIFPQAFSKDSLFITDELTEFRFAEDMQAWHIPADFDSYEKLYSQKKLSQMQSANTPLSMRRNTGVGYISLHEAALSDYAGMTFKKSPDDSLCLEADLVPWPDGVKVRQKPPFKTPWRSIQLSEDAAGLVESNLLLNLNPPVAIENTSWIRAVKYMGIWWEMHLGTHTWEEGPRHGATTERMAGLIEFASEHGIDAVMAEGWNTGWEKWGKPAAFDFVSPCADYDLDSLAAIANDRRVALIGHHETGGDILSYEDMLDSAFQQCQNLGIHYVKTGYAGRIRSGEQHHHGQYMVRHYRRVVEKAAEYEICLNVHEPIKATGISRTFPNMMTREGARGMEWNAWSTGNPPEHHVILPFTRMLAGPMDYNPGIVDILYENAGERMRWNSDSIAYTRVNTTLAKQLALFVVFYSPMQMAADLPGNYENYPQAMEFISRVPVNWEISKVLHADIGEYITIVRQDRHSDDWWLGSITNEKEREFRIKAGFLEEGRHYRAKIYADGKKAGWKVAPLDWNCSEKTFTRDSVLHIHLAPGGGMAVHFVAE